MPKFSLVFDTETTGLRRHPTAKDAVQPRITEFGGALVERGKIVDTMSVLINPQMRLEEVITKITGLTDADLAGQPTFLEHAPRLAAFFRRADAVVAHNLPFDYGMVEGDRVRAGIAEWPWPQRLICTAQEHAEEWGRRPKLKELYEFYTGKPLDQRHRALDDVLALVEVCKAAGVLR